MTKHRVLHFLWSGAIGGAERAVCQLVREEALRGEWEVGVAFGSNRGSYAKVIAGLGCYIVDMRMRGAIDLPKALGAVSQLRDYDIHHFHVMEPLQILASARCAGVTRVFTERGGWDDDQVSLRKRLRRRAGGVLLRKHLHGLSGNTLHAANVARSRYRLESLPLHVTHNGIDFSLLHPSRSRTETRAELGLGTDVFVVGSSGRFKAWKRFERVVDTLATSPDSHVLLVGDGQGRVSLERRALRLDALQRLHITGMVDSVADYLAAMDLFVLASSQAESFGNSVVEAMALGIPSIVFADSPGICEHIEHAKTGFTVHTQEELSMLVRCLAEDPGLRRRIGEAGAAYVRSKYSLENMHSAYQNLYTSALARNRVA